MKKLDKLNKDIIRIVKLAEECQSFEKRKRDIVDEISKAYGVGYHEFNHTMPETMLPSLYLALGKGTFEETEE